MKWKWKGKMLTLFVLNSLSNGQRLVLGNCLLNGTQKWNTNRANDKWSSKYVVFDYYYHYHYSQNCSFLTCPKTPQKKAQTLSLKPGEGYSGVWHKEGMTEGVAGVAVLYVVSVAAWKAKKFQLTLTVFYLCSARRQTFVWRCRQISSRRIDGWPLVSLLFPFLLYYLKYRLYLHRFNRR